MAYKKRKTTAVKRWPLWVRLRLLFKRKYYSYDTDGDDGALTCRVTFKRLDGVLYILKTEFIQPSGPRSGFLRVPEA